MRPHARNNNRASTSSNRPSQYDLSREPSSRRRMQEWRREDERHAYMSGDGYHGSGRDMLEAREPESWPPPGQYNRSRGDWSGSQRYDYGPYSSSSYAEPSSHNPPILPHDSRTAPMDHWREADRQMLPPDDRHLSHDSPNWRQEQRRDKHGHEYPSDSGWESHRRRAWEEPPVSAWEGIPEKVHRIPNEGTWAPALGWQPPTHHKVEDEYPDSYSRAPRVSAVGSTSTSSHRNPYSYSSSTKNNKRNKQPKRDWRDRDDDGPLNNWQRRQVPNASNIPKAPPRKKQRRSPSFSRSPSPVRSYRSPSPAWDQNPSRSQSRSPTSKRQRRGDVPPTPSMRVVNERERGRSSNWVPNSHGLSPYSPKSPSHSHRPADDRVRTTYHSVSRPVRDHSPASLRGYSGDRGRAILRPNSRYAQEASPSPKGSPASYSRRRRSVSSLSSASSGRSPSRSPPDRVRAVHRLPTANGNAVTSPTITPRPTTTGSRKADAHKNGKAHAHGKSYSGERRKGHMRASHLDSMPPPSTVPLHSTHAYLPPEEDPTIPFNLVPSQRIISPQLTDPTPEQPPAFSGFAPVRSAGFKPIRQANLSVKKFFPGDEDEIDTSAEVPLIRGPPIRPMEGEPYGAGRTSSYQNTQPAPIQHERKVWPSPPPTQTPPLPPNLPPTIEQNIPFHDANNAPVFVGAKESRQPSVDSHSRGSITPHETKFSSDIPSTPSPESRDDLYTIISQVGKGTFGQVFKAQNTVSKVYVALKRIRMESEKDGFPVTAMREIKLLQSLQHQNVVRLYQMMVAAGDVYMVFEYMEHDLTGALKHLSFTPAHLKSLCHQMLAGLAYIHHKGVIHRDIKGSNILINKRGELKLGDFGLARFYQKRRRLDYTNRVITTYYRPPELLFGATIYGPEVDMWSAGCIMLELFTKNPVFQGNDDLHQLEVIYKIFGTPTPERWTGIMDLPWYELIKPRETIPNRFRELFQKWLTTAALDLAERLLTYNPAERITALQAMEASYFTEEEPKAMMPTGLEGEWHELESKRERASKKRRESTTETGHV